MALRQVLTHLLPRDPVGHLRHLPNAESTGLIEGDDVTRWRIAAVAVPMSVLVSVLGAGCGTASKPAVVTPVAAATPHAQLVLKPVSGKKIITLRGLVNGGHPIATDRASFDALPARQLTVLEPFIKKTMTFTGVSFADVLTAAKATGKSVTIHALDDFTATMSISSIREAGILLATRADGKVLPLKSGGPMRMIFPSTSEAGKDTNLWVWSIDQITVK